MQPQGRNPQGHGPGMQNPAVQNKVLLPLAGHSVLWWSVQSFLQRADIHQVVVVHAPAERALLRAEVPADARLSWVEGGTERQHSVHRALNSLLAAPPDWVLVHDAARPCLSQGLIESVLQALQHHLAVIPALPVVDALRRRQGKALQVEDREGLLAVQTPQGFHWEVFVKAYQSAKERAILGVDDAQLVQQLPAQVAVIKGERTNPKLTYPEDLALAERLL